MPEHAGAVPDNWYESVGCSDYLCQSSCNISNTKKSVSSGYSNTEKGVEKTRHSRVFFNRLGGVRVPDETLFPVLISLLKPFIILGEIQSKSSQNFMLIKIRYPNHRRGSDLVCFLFMNY